MRFIVVDFLDSHSVVDTEQPPTEDCDHGAVVWTGEPHDRKDPDAQWASARAAEAECNVRNNAAPLDRPRPTEPPPSVELTLDSANTAAAVSETGA